MSRRLPVCCAPAVFLAFSMSFAHPASAGLNAGAVARIRWVAPGGLGDPSRSSYTGRPKLVVTVQGVSSFQGADVQILASALDGDALPDAWLGNGTGGCNDGNFTFSVGGSGVAYPNIFNTAPAVGPVLASQNGEMYNRGGCASPPGIGVLWLSAAGPQGQPRNPALEYAVWSVAFDLRGAAQGGPVDCDGDLSDPNGPRPVLLTSNFRIPCGGPYQGLGIEVLDANLQTDFLPLVDGTGLLGWQTDSIPPNPDLSPPVVTVIRPNGGEIVPVSSFDSLVVNATDNVGPDRMDADLSLDGGANYTLALAHNVPYTPVLLWSVPNTPTVQARVRVTVRDAAGNSGSDVSDANFTIVSNTPPTVSVIYPRGGELIDAGSQVNIVLSGGGVQPGARMDLAYSLDGGATFPGVIALDLPYATSKLWDTPRLVSTMVRVRAVVRNPAGPGGQGMSPSNFSLVDRVAPVVTVIRPNGGESLPGGSFDSLVVNASDYIGPDRMDADLSIDGGANYTVALAHNVPYTPVLLWSVPNTPTGQARVRATVRDVAGNSGSDVSDANFSIVSSSPPTVSVVYPRGGELIDAGSQVNIVLSAGGVQPGARMDLAYSLDGGATFPGVIALNVPYATSKLWDTPGVLSSMVRVLALVHNPGGPAGQGVSPSNFSLVDRFPPVVHVVSPNGGEVINGGAPFTAHFTAVDNLPGPLLMSLRYSTDGGANYLGTIATNIPYADAFMWNVPAVATTHARLQITVTDASGNAGLGGSSSDFTIQLAAPPDTVPPSIAVVEPNGGETYPAGTVAHLRTTASDDRGVVSMDAALSFDGGATYPYVVADHAPYQTSFSWSIPNNPGTRNKVRVTVRDAAGHTATDVSDTVFSIQAFPPDTIPPLVTIITPNGGESFPAGGYGSMLSVANDNIGVTTLDLALSINGGASYDHALLQHVPYQPSVLWPVPAVSTPNARLRATVYDAAGNSSTDYSDANFYLIPPGGANQGGIARAYWIVPGDSASPSRRSDSGQARLLVTLKGIHNFRGADVQLLISSVDGGSLPDAWQGNPGGCNDGNITFGLGSVGSRYPSAFNSAPAVPGVVASQDGEFLETGDCKTPRGAGLFWLSAAGAAGEPRDPTKEYALWNIRVDLRGTAQGGPTDCSGDLGDPAGPRGVEICPNFRIPCNQSEQGAVVAVVDDNLNIDFLPFVLGKASLGWEADPSCGHPTPVLLADLEAHGAGADIELTWTIVNPSEVREVEVRRRDSGSDAFTQVAILSPVQGDMRWLDGTAQPFRDHEYVLILRGFGGEEAAIHYKFIGVAETFRLAAPYPNPSLRPVTIRYSMDHEAPMALEVLDVRGTRVRLVQQGQAQPGEHAAEWDGRDEAGRAAPSGVYFLRLSSGDKSTVRRVVRL